MRKWVLVLMMVGLCATMASAAGGLGIFGSYWDTKDLGPGFGGGVKFSGDHCCPNITQTAVIGYGSRVFWFCNPMPEMPVKWGFSQTARRSISVELCRVPSQFGDVF